MRLASELLGAYRDEAPFPGSLRSKFRAARLAAYRFQGSEVPEAA